MEEAKGVDKIHEAAEEVQSQQVIHPNQDVPHNNFQNLSQYVQEALLAEAINEGYGLAVMQKVLCAASGLATPILDEISEMPSEEEAIIIARVKCVAHSDAVEGGQQISPVGVLDCSTVVAMHVAGRPLLLETIGARTPIDDWSRRHFNNRSYQTPDGLESPKEATVAHLATLIGYQRLVVGWRLGLDLASLGLGVSTVLAIDLSTDPVVRAFFQDLVQEGSVAKDAVDLIMSKSELPIPITLACAILTGNQVNLRDSQMEERDVVREAYIIGPIWLSSVVRLENGEVPRNGKLR